MRPAKYELFIRERRHPPPRLRERDGEGLLRRRVQRRIVARAAATRGQARAALSREVLRQDRGG
jgi:hypothetical protein